MIGFNHLGIVGRLGNQMFQYATLRAIADKHGYDFTIPKSNFQDEWNDHQLFEAFKLPNLKNRGMVSGKYLQERQFHFDQELVDQCSDNVSLYGYFQTEKYFSSIADSIKEDFRFHDEIYNNCKEVMDGMDNPIALHVRRTDYVEKSQDHPPCSMNYYKQALKQFPEDQQVVIFSDDVRWCKEQELFKSDRFLVSETDDNLYDLCMMTMCKGYIIANSSFSWWGAWLSETENPKVIAPSRWFGDTGYTAKNNTQDIVPDRWTKI
tara:strand:+ start:2686 stop:3477 length:792 start_codon:yes stop_codon:yes gene_type:complete